MNTTLRAGWLVIVLFSMISLSSAQTNVQDELARADKQYDLYAYNLALRTYDNVLKLDPNNAHALGRTADCYQMLNRPEEALPYYDRAVLQSKADPEMMFHYGKTLMETGDYVGAKKWFLFYAQGNAAVGRHYADMCDYAMAASRKDAMYKVRNEPTNTTSADYGVALYGTRVVYNSSRNDIQRTTTPKSSQDWTGSAYNQLYMTQRNPTDGYLQKPSFLQSDLENNYNEGPVSFSADGRKVAFCKNNFIDGTKQIAGKGLNMSLYTADVVDGKWTNIKSFPYNGSEFATGFPCLSADGKTMYFSSNQPTGMGGWDIYVSTFEGGNWTSPRNLGGPLNTAGNEVTPFLNGNDLYFSSDWHNGLGGLDVFRAELNGDAVTNIYHLGPGINSSRDDYGFVYDDVTNYGYVTSCRPQGRGNEDIWQVRKTTTTYTF
ncbi:MAG: PD40 domain-containing protein [Lewinellaceae bacterium]|nr:PD40 domain-containing protein [Lewinellaceae bacterium]